jgi:hypothetical protein
MDRVWTSIAADQVAALFADEAHVRVFLEVC